MSNIDHSQPTRFSEAEKKMIFRAVLVGLIASLLTLWQGNAFDTDDPSFFSLETVLAGLTLLAVAGAFSIMAESIIEDIIKVVMFGVLYWFTRQYTSFDLVTLGMLTGGVTGFFNNRLPSGKADRLS